jgi:hypothetical protein
VTDLDAFLSGVLRDVTDPPTRITVAGEPMSCLCGSDEFTIRGDGTFECRDCTRVWEGA